MSWAGLAILTTGLLMNSLQRPELGKAYENYWKDRSTTSSATSGSMGLQNSDWSEETIGNSGSPYGFDYWCRWDNLIAYTTPCSNYSDLGFEMWRERGPSGLGVPSETTWAETQHDSMGQTQRDTMNSNAEWYDFGTPTSPTKNTGVFSRTWWVNGSRKSTALGKLLRSLTHGAGPSRWHLCWHSSVLTGVPSELDCGRLNGTRKGRQGLHPCCRLTSATAHGRKSSTVSPPPVGDSGKLRPVL